MITTKDIIEYFDYEVEESNKSWESLMALPLKERIRKRKAITDVQMVKGSEGRTGNDHKLFRFSFSKNLSDFREGDLLLLHREDNIHGMSCTLYEYNGENEITIDVFPPNMNYTVEELEHGKWVIDKDKTDLRGTVYSKFYFRLPSDEDYWQKHLLNNPTCPIFQNEQFVEEKLEETILNWGLQLTQKQREAIFKSMAAQDYYLIQGPPGTGKSFVLSMIILEEIFDLGHNVVVVGPNHMAINNVLIQVLKLIPFYAYRILKIGQSYHAPKVKVMDDQGNEQEIVCGEYLDWYVASHWENKPIIGFTPYCFYTNRAGGYDCDTLIIDEAGQMTIPLGLMGMFKAKKVILAGDHKQLPPIITSDKISNELKQSIFQKLMRPNNHTMLDVSFRMCGPICNFVSELFYDGELKAKNVKVSDRIICSDKLLSFDTSIVMLNVEDDGEQVSEKEAESILNIIKQYISLGLPATEIGVLSPFRAQAAHIRRLLKKEPNIDANDIAVDTIDKMQGQERDVIITSLVAGDIDYMIEMADFLYNPNKLNVAFSRAKSKLIVVGNLTRLKQIDLSPYPHIKKMLEYEKAEFLGV